MKGEMAKCYFSNTTLLLYDLLSLFSFILSQPLYFAYFLFFFPYLLKFLSFLYPLLFSTSLLLIALLTVSPHAYPSHLYTQNSQCGFFIISFQKVLDALRTSLDGDPNIDLIDTLALLVLELEASVGSQEVIEAAIGTVENSSHGGFAREIEQKSFASEALIFKEEANTVEVSQENKFEEYESWEITCSSLGEASAKSLVNDPEAYESQDVTSLSSRSNPITVGTASQALTYKAGEIHEEVALGNDSKAYKSRDGCGLETTCMVSQALPYELGENAAKVPLGNDPKTHESQDVMSLSSGRLGFDVETVGTKSQTLAYKVEESLAKFSLGNDPELGLRNFGCGVEDTSMVSQAQPYEVGENLAEVPPGDDPEAYESQDVTSSSSESFGFDLETASSVSQALSYKVGESPVENDPEEYPSQAVASLGLGNFGCALETINMMSQALPYRVGEKPVEVPLGNDPEAYESQDVTSSSHGSFDSGIEMASPVSQPLPYRVGEKPVEVPLGNDPESPNVTSSSHGSFGSGLETASLASQALPYRVGEKTVEVPLENDPEAYESQDVMSSGRGSFGSGFEPASPGSQAQIYKVGENIVGGNYYETALRGPMSPDSMCSSPGGFGSMRREKEWRRTLACKLYEERMTVDGIEGMDSLWEAYEADSGKAKMVSKKEKKAKKVETERREEEEEEEEDMDDGQLCCLQALRFSTGKMNLGMRRPSLVKISKAFKGMGMFVRGKGKSFSRNLDLQGLRKRSEDAHRRFDRLIERIIKEHEEARKMNGGDGAKDVLNILLDVSEDESAEVKLTRDNIKAFMLGIFVGGTDTSSITIEWALAELINHPDILVKARAEIDSVVGKERLVEESDVHNLPYIQAIVKETFRLHPTIPLIVRECTNECKINGYDIPVNSQVFISVWAIGRDPKYWDGPLEFRPERFMPSDKESDQSWVDVRGQHFQLVPFGSGRRGCPGMNLALHVIHTTIALMVQCFDWKIGDGEENPVLDMTEGRGLSLPRSQPLVCVPVAHLNPFPFDQLGNGTN